MVELIEIGVLSALGAWVLTQIHLIFAVRRIKADIDQKRSATEAFVKQHLGTLGTDLEQHLGGFEARMHAEIPPNVHGELEEVRAEIEEINVGLRKEFENLPNRIRGSFGGSGDAEQRQFLAMAKESEGAMHDAVTMQAALAQNDPEVLRASTVKRVMDMQVSKAYAKDHPLIVAALELGKPKLLEMLGVSSGTGTSVTYRVTSKGGGASPF